MNTVHRPAIEIAHSGRMKPARTLLLAALLASPAIAQDDERQEIYDSFLSCAAFHTIEASRADGNAAAAQQATAYDYAEAAAAFAPDGTTTTANADLKAMLESFEAKLKSGEPRAMAEQWTALESSCRDLYPIKDELVKRQKARADATASPDSR